MPRSSYIGNVLAVVPARGGSKGVHRKNLRLLKGKPLIEYTLQTSLASKYISRLIVSTDDPEIASFSRSLGVEVPFMRPAALASDTASQMDVVLHALEYFQRTNGILYDIVLLLQPTAPLRIVDDIEGALDLLFTAQADSVVSFNLVEHNHPYYMYKITDGNPKPLFEIPVGVTRRQDFPPIYIRNGAIYAARSSLLIEQRTFYGKDMRAYIMPSNRSINIDTELDFALAEVFLQNQNFSRKVERIDQNT
jgi:CMP-N,N'-diacetyllegionaminic acid synthase